MASIPLPALHVETPQQPDLVGQYSRLLQLKNMQALAPLQLQQAQQSVQSGQLQLQQQQREADSQKAIMDAWSNSGGDLGKTYEAAAKTGKVLPGDLAKLQQAHFQLQEQAYKTLQEKGNRAIQEADFMDGAADAVKNAPPEAKPIVYQQQIANLAKAGVDVSQIPQQYPGDQAFTSISLGLKSHKAALEQAKTQAQTNEAASRSHEADVNAQKTQQESQYLQNNGMAPGVPLDTQAAIDWMRKNPGKSLSDFVAWKAKQAPLAQLNVQAGLLNDQAKQMAAQTYAQTGQLPAGMRSPTMSAQILNQAASANPGVNIAANKATFQADSASLKKLQENFDNVTAFENTAGKNLDQFLKTAKDVVDSGSPLINSPLRSLSSQAIGSDKMAAFNAARQTALTEIAKVLSSANAGSGVVSDSARHEVEGLIGPNASLKQIYAAANILKQDMANRHQSYSDQIKTIKGRMGGGNAQPEANKENDPLGIR